MWYLVTLSRKRNGTKKADEPPALIVQYVLSCHACNSQPAGYTSGAYTL